MDKAQVSAVFEEIALLLELEGKSPSNTLVCTG
jgi:hypothetical protein